MSIRDTVFWKQIEPIFSNRPAAARCASPFGAGERSIYRYAAFRARVRRALAKADRNERHVFLLLMDLQRHDQGWSGVTDPEASDVTLSRVASCLRSGDSVCALAGGRIAILVEGAADPKMAAIVTRKIQETVSSPLTTEAGTVVFRPCFGAAIFPTDTRDEAGLWSLAKMALQTAIALPPDALSPGWVREGQFNMERLELNQELYRAYRQQEFRLLYQPVFSAKSGRIASVEALLRWQHPQRGLLSPDAFLNALEESGLIVPVGEWILQESCRMVRMLVDNGCTPVVVSVNISARQMADPGFMVAVLDALYDTSIDAQFLQLEFSEQVIGGDPDAAQRVLPALRTAGVGVAIDRFGAGGLGAAELVRLPATAIKIDRSLIAGLDHDLLSVAIVSAIVAFANGSGTGVAAVGVEYPLQGDLLERMGCGEVQGSLLSKPQPAAELVQRLRS